MDKINMSDNKKKYKLPEIVYKHSSLLVDL